MCGSAHGFMFDDEHLSFGTFSLAPAIVSAQENATPN